MTSRNDPWDDVRAAMRAAFDVIRDEAGWIAVRPRAGGPLVRVELARAFDADWLLLLAPVCGEEELPHRVALSHSLRLALGSLVLDGEHYELKATLPLAEADLTSLAARIASLSAEAGRLRALVLARASAAEPHIFDGE